MPTDKSGSPRVSFSKAPPPARLPFPPVARHTRDLLPRHPLQARGTVPLGVVPRIPHQLVPLGPVRIEQLLPDVVAYRPLGEEARGAVRPRALVPRDVPEVANSILRCGILAVGAPPGGTPLLPSAGALPAPPDAARADGTGGAAGPLDDEGGGAAGEVEEEPRGEEWDGASRLRTFPPLPSPLRTPPRAAVGGAGGGGSLPRIRAGVQRPVPALPPPGACLGAGDERVRELPAPSRGRARTLTLGRRGRGRFRAAPPPRRRAGVRRRGRLVRRRVGGILVLRGAAAALLVAVLLAGRTRDEPVVPRLGLRIAPLRKTRRRGPDPVDPGRPRLL
mmetsp:Transcript_31140/g.70411  ORF Transcript_31140/g.70411 Transcript_31140/m.70411 type:complete len:334 (+) Transcript_31140:166-1167(+)